MPVTNEIVNTQSTAAAQVVLEPAHNIISSLRLLHKHERMSGTNVWVESTAVAMSPAQKHQNKLVMDGLYHAVEPEHSWSSFPNYVDHLSQSDPYHLRQKIFNIYEKICDSSEKTGVPLDIDTVLASPGAYLDYLFERFGDSHIDVQIETETYALLKEPERLRSTIVAHLRDMWDTYLEEEWNKQKPLLLSCIQAFQQIDFSGLTLEESMEVVLGSDVPHWWERINKWPQLSTIKFVPTPHLGPYIHTFKTLNNNVMWVAFGAKMPQGSQNIVPDLSRSDILVRVNALADDTRLRIIQIIKDKGELRSQDIREYLDLSQSAGSRHLKQLSATGYLIERRVEGSKCYSLNRNRIEDTLNALSHFLIS